MVEVDRVELEGPALREQLVPLQRVREGVASPAAVGDVDDALDARQGGADLCYLPPALDGLVAVGVAGEREQQLRLELAEAVDHAPRPELRGAGGPDRTEARGRE